MRKIALIAGIVILALASAAVISILDKPHTRHSSAQQPAPFQLVEVASDFSRPLYLTNAGDGSNRLFVVEQSGKIWILQDGTRLETPFLDVSDRISREALGGDYTERGLLGLAFPPDYAQTGAFYINYTDLNGNTVVARYHVSADDPNAADPASEAQMLTVEQPYPNHNGGQLAFGPDGYLYIGLGDGGSQGDPNGNGQNTGVLLAKILRLDVSGDDGYAIPPTNPFANDAVARPEVWAYGLRNPWRFSFDRQTGDLYIADVGQNTWEEVNFQPADSAGGENYGWNIYEGNHAYAGGNPPPNLTLPFAEYSHDTGGCSVTGGYVYRGSGLPDLQGYYFFGDWCSGNLWASQKDASGTWQTNLVLQTGREISSFGEDEAGELYLLDYAGAVLQFAPAQ